MDIPVEIDGFEGRGVRLRAAGIFSKPKLFIDGQAASGKRGRYLLRDNHGKQRICSLRFNGLDPIPKFQVGDRQLEVIRRLKWYEYAWIALPVVLIVTGGVLGVLCGLPAIYWSARIFRSARGTMQKFLMTGAVSVASVLTFVVAAVLVGVLIDAL